MLSCCCYHYRPEELKLPTAEGPHQRIKGRAASHGHSHGDRSPVTNPSPDPAPVPT